MKSLNRSSPVLTITLLAIAEFVYGAQPPDVVTSDAYGDTAMGSGALLNLTTGLGVFNTAVGMDTLTLNTEGIENTAVGTGALYSNTTGLDNTAIGSGALDYNTTGQANTALGQNALLSNTTGTGNTASGVATLVNNTTGNDNAGFGASALSYNTTGSSNTAIGTGTLELNTTGSQNTASGNSALFSNTTGYNNNAMGSQSLFLNTTGYYNNAVGYNAMYATTTGYNNNAQGSYALSANTSGYGNNAMGANAFLNLTTGFRNVGVGNNTGTNVLAGAYDTYIGWGAAGTVDETGVTRIGNPTYATSTYIAGLNSVVTGAALYVSSSGQVGVLASSERYKTDIATLPAPTDRLGQLRPVSFHLKSEPEGTLQYGLIAEEVAKIYPELVLHDPSGQIQGVRYDELAPLLLSEVQEQRRALAGELAKVDRLEQQLSVLQGQNQHMLEMLHALRLPDTRPQGHN
jgi:hypothetical protein